MAILDWLKEVPLSAIYKERLLEAEKQIAALEEKVLILERENVELKAALSQCEEDRRALNETVIHQIAESHKVNPDGYVCDHCASINLRRTGSRPDPAFGQLGIKQKVFVCNDCGKESAFTPD